MYTLRILKSDGREVNYFLGDCYTIWKRNTINELEFSDICEEVFGDANGQFDEVASNKANSTSAFVDWPLAESKLPIFSSDKAYIMHANGQTLQKL